MTKYIKYNIVSGGCFALATSLFLLLKNYDEISAWFVANFLAGGVVSFFLHLFFVFTNNDYTFRQHNKHPHYDKTKVFLLLVMKLACLKRRSKVFTFQGKIYQYFLHWYNTTWRNERSVEVAIALKLLEGHQGEDVLEIGNVLQHYISFSHDIVDKYEKAEGVMNIDIVDFKGKQYSLIICLSTLEHVGWDEEPKDASKVLSALSNIENHLRPNGELLITLPLGYNPFVDDLLNREELTSYQKTFMRRVGSEWIETKGCHFEPYNFREHKANTLAILTSGGRRSA